MNIFILKAFKSLKTFKSFKSLYPTLKFYKLTTNNGNHNGYQFKDGLNVDTNPINTNKCGSG